MKKVLSFIGGILAFLTVIMYALLFIDSVYSFLPEAAVAFMEGIKLFAVLVVCAITGLEFAFSTKSVFVVILFCLILAVVIVFMFFPGVLASAGIAVPAK